MKQEEKDYNENQLGMVLFSIQFSETLDKQREMGGEAFIAKKQGGKPNEADVYLSFCRTTKKRR